MGLRLCWGYSGIKKDRFINLFILELEMNLLSLARRHSLSTLNAQKAPLLVPQR